ncbi:hypothetical protein H4219_001879 [Mycoemilia scoparia]|uniref:Glucose receptor Git3-like N-terminal domain-containing protein n=1 Tax=Mycoemilia scoparia TaxID=417184 RepID=A0A9W8A8G1_9FUNG|nr:hypothetical protein H4219_001879 [Mycoemilia scoparia]
MDRHFPSGSTLSSVTFGLVGSILSVIGCSFVAWRLSRLQLMQWKVRHTLILCLFIADAIYAVTNTVSAIGILYKSGHDGSKGGIHKRAHCIASGFFSQWSSQAQDLAVLLISFATLVSVRQSRKWLHGLSWVQMYLKVFLGSVWTISLGVAVLTMFLWNYYDSEFNYCWVKPNPITPRWLTMDMWRILVILCVLTVYIFVIISFYRRQRLVELNAEAGGSVSIFNTTTGSNTTNHTIASSKSSAHSAYSDSPAQHALPKGKEDKSFDDAHDTNYTQANMGSEAEIQQFPTSLARLHQATRNARYSLQASHGGSFDDKGRSSPLVYPISVLRRWVSRPATTYSESNPSMDIILGPRSEMTPVPMPVKCPEYKPANESDSCKDSKASHRLSFVRRFTLLTNIPSSRMSFSMRPPWYDSEFSSANETSPSRFSWRPWTSSARTESRQDSIGDATDKRSSLYCQPFSELAIPFRESGLLESINNQPEAFAPIEKHLLHNHHSSKQSNLKNEIKRDSLDLQSPASDGDVESMPEGYDSSTKTSGGSQRPSVDAVISKPNASRVYSHTVQSARCFHSPVKVPLKRFASIATPYQHFMASRGTKSINGLFCPNSEETAIVVEPSIKSSSSIRPFSNPGPGLNVIGKERLSVDMYSRTSVSRTPQMGVKDIEFPYPPRSTPLQATPSDDDSKVFPGFLETIDEKSADCESTTTINNNPEKKETELPTRLQRGFRTRRSSLNIGLGPQYFRQRQSHRSNIHTYPPILSRMFVYPLAYCVLWLPYVAYICALTVLMSSTTSPNFSVKPVASLDTFRDQSVVDSDYQPPVHVISKLSWLLILQGTHQYRGLVDALIYFITEG